MSIKTVDFIKLYKNLIQCLKKKVLNNNFIKFFHKCKQVQNQDFMWGGGE